MTRKVQILAVLAIVFIVSACRQPFDGGSNFYNLPAKLGDDWQMVVEIPAGTNLKLEYNKERDAFLPDSLDGQSRIVDFLPYPGNYGFIPSTIMDIDTGGDGDPVDVLLISEALPTGTVIRIQPIGALLLVDNGEKDIKIIAVPKDLSTRTLQADGFEPFSIQYQPVKRLVEDWFMNYKGPGHMEFLGWRDESAAHRLIRESLISVEIE